MMKCENRENRIISISDDFDMEKIITCGQCFRAKRLENGFYRFITGKNVAYIKENGNCSWQVICSENSWDSVWKPYFDLERDYRSIRSRCSGHDDFLDKAMRYGCGIRILRQDPWEMLVTFIISQRKNIPAISNAVELLSQKYGEKAVTEFETIHLFPSPAELCELSEEDLRLCGLGYRAAYVKDAITKVSDGTLDLSLLGEKTDEELFDSLLTVHGVGKKIANCVCLFGYGRTSRVPVDVWMSRVIEQDYNGNAFFSDFGENAGIIQQYLFYYKKNQKNLREEGEKNAGIDTMDP